MSRQYELVGLVFVVLLCGLLALVVAYLPVHIFLEYGFASGPVYDRGGHVTGQANYFLWGLLMFVFGEVLCCVIGMAALKRIRELKRPD